MKVIIFGATGMVGQGVLRECLLNPEVEAILSVGRNAPGMQHEKLYDAIRRKDADEAESLMKGLIKYGSSVLRKQQKKKSVFLQMTISLIMLSNNSVRQES